MNKINVSIELDPINDGITNFEELIEVEDVRGVVVATTGKWRPISGDDITEIFDRLQMNSEAVVLGDYLGCINNEKSFNISGERYFVGSVVMFKCAGQCSPISPLTKVDINQMVKTLRNRLVQITFNGQAVTAYPLD